MKESLATFRKAVNESADLQAKLKGGTDLVELGKENGYDFSQEDVTAAFEELKDSDEELTGFNAQLEAESGGSGSGSGGSSLVGSSLVKNSDEGTHRLPPVLTERNARVAVLKRKVGTVADRVVAGVLLGGCGVADLCWWRLRFVGCAEVSSMMPRV